MAPPTRRRPWRRATSATRYSSAWDSGVEECRRRNSSTSSAVWPSSKARRRLASWMRQVPDPAASRSARPASRVSTPGASPPGATTVRSPASRNRSGPSGSTASAASASPPGPSPSSQRSAASPAWARPPSTTATPRKAAASSIARTVASSSSGPLPPGSGHTIGPRQASTRASPPTPAAPGPDENLEEGAAAGGGGGEAAAGEGSGAVAGDEVVLDGEVGGAPGGGEVGPAPGAGGGQPGVGLGAQAERALAEGTADGQDPGLDEQVDQQGELLVGQVEVTGQAAEVADGHGAGTDQGQGLAVEPGADALGGDHGPGGGGGCPGRAVGDRVDRLGGRRPRPLREHQAAPQPKGGLPRHHQLAVGDGQQQAALQQPAGRLGVRVAGEAAVADPHHGDRPGRGHGLLQQPPGALVGLGRRPRHRRRVGQGRAHGPDEVRLAGPRRPGDAQVGQDALQLHGAHPDLGQLGHGRAEAAWPAERRPQRRRPGDGPVRAGQGDPQLGQGGQAGLQARRVEPGAGGLGQGGHGRGQADHRQQLGQPEGTQVEGAQGRGQRRRRARPAGQLRERRRRRRTAQVRPALEQPEQLGVGEAGKGGRVARYQSSSGTGARHRGLPPKRRARTTQNTGFPAAGPRSGWPGG